MTRKRVLHVCHMDKFIPPYIELSRKELLCVDNFFFLFGDLSKYPTHLGKDTFHSQSIFIRFLAFIYHLNIADKIVLHGLFNRAVVFVLFFQPWLLKKANWVIWGGDLYVYREEINKASLKSKIWFFIKKKVISQLDGLITYIKGDYDLAKEWYGAKGKYIECIMYTSNIYRDLDVPLKSNNKITFLIGNSADPSNNHLEIISKLKPFKDDDIRVVCPLSYGDMDYAKEIAVEGLKVFGSKFEPLLRFLSLSDYLKLLSDVDIAIFAHNRQQGMGNAITLLGMGKTIYLKKPTTTWEFLSGIQLNVRDFDGFNAELCNSNQVNDNVNKIKFLFSKERLVTQLINLLISD